MKKLIFVIAIFCKLQNHECLGQITRDTVIQTWNAIAYDFYPVHISENETKYFIQDTLNNTFNLYNLDFTPFLTNIFVPEPFLPFSALMEVIYISRTLFDCDSSNIEYAYTSYGSGYHPFYIMRTDGTQLFKLDSALAPYCLGCLNGSQDQRPIINTENGAKLFLYYPQNTNNLNIFSLCGKLPPPLYTLSEKGDISSLFKVSPNPSTGKIKIETAKEFKYVDYTVIIRDANMRELFYLQVNDSKKESYSLDVSNFSVGVYFISFYNSSRMIYSQRIILSK